MKEEEIMMKILLEELEKRGWRYSCDDEGSYTYDKPCECGSTGASLIFFATEGFEPESACIEIYKCENCGRYILVTFALEHCFTIFDSYYEALSDAYDWLCWYCDAFYRSEYE